MTDEADAFGLCDGLHASRSQSQYRCSECHTMQRAGSWQVFVPRSVQRHDPNWSVTEAVRRSAHNGQWIAWCIDCAPKKKSPDRQSDNLFPVIFGLAMLIAGGFAIVSVLTGLR